MAASNMEEETQGSRQPGRNPLAVSVAVLLVLSLGVAAALGHSFDVQAQARATVFVVVAGLCGWPLVWRDGRSFWFPALALGIVALVVLGSRAALSPVWDLARLDLNLLGAGWVCLVLVVCLRGHRAALGVLLAGLAVLILANGVLAAGQAWRGQSFVLWGNPDDPARRAVGFFGHANPMAGFVAIALPVLAGATVVVKSRALRALLLLALISGFVALALSNSRGGAVAAIVGFLALAGSFVLARSRAWSPGAQWLSRGALLGLLVGMIPLSFAVVNHLSEKRGHGSGVERILSKNGRLDFMGLALEQWSEEPLAGGGSRSFSYECVKRWDAQDIGSWVGNAVMVHCDYLQVLADYGLLGLAVLLAFLFLGLVRLPLRGILGVRGEPAGGLEFGALGGLMAALCHAAYDFTAHVLPVAMLVGVVLGLLLSQAGSRAKPGAGALALLSALAAVAILVATSYRDWRTAGTFLSLERSLMQGRFGEEEVTRTRTLLAQAPQFEIARMHGRYHLDRFRESGYNETANLAEAVRAFEIAVTRHPYDAESLGNYALVLNLAGEDEKADQVYRRAIEACWRREKDFGILRAYSDFLTKLGEKAWQKRQPGRALALFRRAYEFHQASLRLRFRRETKADRLTRERWLRERIEFLEGAGISAEALDEVPVPPTRN